MNIAIFFDCNIIVAGILFAFNPFDRKRVRAGWAKLAFGIMAVISITVGVFRLGWDLDYLQLDPDVFYRVNNYVNIAFGVVIGVAMALVMSGQFTGARPGAEPGSSGGDPSLKRIITIACITAIATTAMVFYGSKQALPPGAVSFDGSGIALVPGADWQQKDAPSGRQLVCPPVLSGQEPDGGMIKVYATAGEADVQSGVAHFRSQAAATPGVLQDSIKQEDFTSDNGVRGIHLSYEYSPTGENKVRAHDYLFQNKQGRCVVIFYLTLADKDTDTVHQMIRKTLILE